MELIKRMMRLFGAGSADQDDLDALSADDERLGLNIREVVKAHVQWHKHFVEVIDGGKSLDVEADKVGMDIHCELGQWIHGYGRQRFGSHKEFKRLYVTHQDFHKASGDLVKLLRAGKRDKALDLLHGPVKEASDQILLDLNLLLGALRRQD